jgi:peptide/nickel transport system permease protein
VIRFLFVRLLRLLIVFLVVSVFVSFLVNLTPGEPAEAIAGEDASAEVIAALNERYGFDDPPIQRWAMWVGSVVRGDFGESFLTRQPVTSIIADRLPVTAYLALFATLMTLILVVPLGLLAAYRRGSWIDRAANALSSLLISIPSFVLALSLVALLAIQFQLFPIANWVSPTDSFFGSVRAAFLPSLTLALTEAAILLPVLRSDALNTLEQDYINLARAKGISTARLLVRHVLRPSSIALVTLMGLSLARLFGGAVIVESVFNLPGIGRSLISSIRTKDLIVTQGLVMFTALVYLAANFLVDVLYSRLDPRIVTK